MSWQSIQEFKRINGYSPYDAMYPTDRGEEDPQGWSVSELRASCYSLTLALRQAYEDFPPGPEYDLCRYRIKVALIESARDEL